jgi:hypothetical protein
VAIAFLAVIWCATDRRLLFQNADGNIFALIQKRNQMQIEPVMTYRFRTRGPLGETAGSPLGNRQYWEMTEGTLTGNGINARIAMPGGAWTKLSPDGCSRPDVRVQLVTDDGMMILLHYTGLIQVNDGFRQAAVNNTATDFEDHYMRMVMQFDTGAKKYEWMNKYLFLAEGRLHGTNEVEYRIYQVN